MSIEQVSDNFWFIFFAYIAAFLPWAVLAAKDFIGPTWKTIRDTRRAGKANIFLSAIPACYIVAYIIVQGLSLDYKEMCAALVALMFSVLNLLRTLWGLWQLHYFERWAINSIDALEAMGVPYNLTKPEKRDTPDCATGFTDSISFVDSLLVNETIIDNQLKHGETRCYIQYGELMLKGGEDGDPPVVRYVRGVWQGLCIAMCWLFDIGGTIFGHRKRRRMELKPFHPVKVWLNWSVALAAQGLGQWIDEFSVPTDPKSQPGYDDLTARERYDKRAQYFGLELVSSAWIQLWSEVGLSAVGWPTSPFRWDEWGEKSNMADGRIVKQELLRKAMENGKGLPFGASHDIVSWMNELGYRVYRRELEQIVNELPVRCEFGVAIERFDVERLEWLAILLYLGMVATSMQEQSIDDESDSQNPTTASNGSGSLSSSMHSEASDLCPGTGGPPAGAASIKSLPSSEVDSAALDVDISQALTNLRTQLNLRLCRSNHEKADKYSPMDSHLFQCASIKIPKASATFLSDENRHVSRVGEMVDAWMALVAGDQISFLTEVNGTSFWEDVCHCGGRADASKEESSASYSPEVSKAVQTIHAEVEKRRLFYNIANETDWYDSYDHFVTFMGYGMEAVRSRLGDWVRRNQEVYQDGILQENSFRPLIENDKTVSVQLGFELSRAMLGGVAHSILSHRAVQTRLLWELQQGLMKDGNDGPGSVSNIALCVLSFPSLLLEQDKESKESVSCEETQSSVFVQFCDCFGKSVSQDDTNGANGGLPNIKISARGGPQRVEVIGRFLKKETTLCVKLSLSGADEAAKFEWRLWRDAFLGRLMGFKEWQEEHGIHSGELNVTVGDMRAELEELLSPTGEKVSCWPGWKPFRFGIIRFELESEGLLKEQVETELVAPCYEDPSPLVINEGQKDGVSPVLRSMANNATCIGTFYRVQVRAVKYAKASPVVLRHGFLLVQQAFLPENLRSQVTNEKHGAEFLIEVADKCHEDGDDWERALLLFEFAATLHGNVRALDKCIDIIMERTSGRTSAPRVVSVLERFVAQLFPSDRRQGLKLPNTDMDKVSNCVLPNILKVMNRFGDEDMILKRLTKLLETVWLIDPERFMKEALAARQIVYSMTRCAGILTTQVEHLLNRAVSGPFNEKLVSNIKSLTTHCTSATGDDMVVLELTRDTWHICKSFCRKAFRESEGPERYTAAFRLASLLERLSDANEADIREAMTLYRLVIDSGESDVAATAVNNLAVRLHAGGKGVAPSLAEAQELYRCMIESDDTYAMNNLAYLLHHGAEGVAPNPIEAEALYRRATELGNMNAMNNLALLLHYGAQGVAQNAREAETLYRRAIKLGDVDALSNLGLLLEKGGEGVMLNAVEAEELHRRAIEHGNVTALNNLGNLLIRGDHGVTSNAIEAEELLRRAVERGSIFARASLANLLLRGAEGVDRNPVEAERLYRSAIEGGILDAMNNLGYLLYQGAEGVAQNWVEAEALYRRATECGHVLAMNNLGLLLENGGKGVTQDLREARVLYRRAVERGSAEAMYNLASLLSDGPEAAEAEALYRRAIAEQNDSGSMHNLGLLMRRGGEGVEANAREALTLLRRAVDTGHNGESMYALGMLLEDGDEGVAADAVEAMALYKQAIEEEGHTGAMYRLGRLLEKGAEGVRRDARAAVELYERAAEEGKDVRAMYRCARLLEEGAKDVEIDVDRARKLYEDAGDHKNARKRLSALQERLAREER